MMQITKRVVSFKFGVLAIIIGLMLAALTVATPLPYWVCLPCR